jgi:hypothetical protein
MLLFDLLTKRLVHHNPSALERPHKKIPAELGVNLIHEDGWVMVCLYTGICKTSANSFACNLDKAARILAEFLPLEYPLDKNNPRLLNDFKAAISGILFQASNAVVHFSPRQEAPPPSPNCDIIFFQQLRRSYRALP